MQIVFQDPYASLNPRFRVRQILYEPFRIHGISKAVASQKIPELLSLVQLPPDSLRRFPHEFSGGQRQRIAIARALALEPSLLVLDEPVSALDVSIQAQILNLLEGLQTELGLAYLFIAHDLSVVGQVSDRVAVMYLGRIVEEGPRDAVFNSPQHPYTIALLSAIPDISAAQGRQTRERIILVGDLPNPLDPPSGCRFRTRCWRGDQLCVDQEPPLAPVSDSLVACHYPGPEDHSGTRS
jgi:oligopeptide/dipeptide ABC transporter ATP-binding protein